MFSLGYKACKIKFLEEANKGLKEEITQTHQKIASINEAKQEMKPYVEKSFRKAADSQRQELIKIHNSNIEALQSKVPKMVVSHTETAKKSSNEPMSPGTKRKYFGPLFPSLEKEYNDGSDPVTLLMKYKKIGKEQRRMSP